MTSSPLDPAPCGPGATPHGRRVAFETRPLVLVAAALALWLLRAWLVGPRHTWFLWNLVLAVSPWLISAWLCARPRPAVLFAPLACGWLCLLPNAPYLVTDLVHLKARPPVPLWLDVLFFAAFALAGCALGLASLRAMARELERRFGAGVSRAAVPVVLVLCAWGVFLGRFLRLNSWDVVTRPGALLAANAAALQQAEPLVFTAAFAALLGALYVAFGPRRPASTSDDA